MLVEITRSRRAVLLLTVGAALLVLQSALGCVTYAILTPANVRASRDLGTAADWLAFTAFAAGLAAVALTGWEAIIGRGGQSAVDLLGAGGSSLLMTIGQLVVAANSPNGSDAGSVVIAVGVGGWMIVALVAAARRSIAERTGGLPAQADLWLLASGSLLLLAVAVGLPSPTGRGRALPIATGVLFLLAYAGLAATFDRSTRRRLIANRCIVTLIAGLAAMAVAYLALAVGSGFVWGPSAGLTTIRVGLSIPQFLMAVAGTILAVAAFQRLSDLTALPAGAPTGPEFSAPPGYPPPGYQPPPPAPPGRGWSIRRPRRSSAGWSAAPPAPPDPATTAPVGTSPEAAHCGAPLPPGAAFCPRCGQPVTTNPV